jgi:hypothetical protein
LGLDNLSAFIRIGKSASYMPGCEHKRTELLMRRDGVDYVRCVDCDQVLEADDLEQVAPYDDAVEEDEQPRRKRAS